SSLMSTPGSTRAVFCTGSMSRILLRWREKSMTRPGPIEFPACEVPPPRDVIGTECDLATSRIVTTSAVVFGKATTCGTTLSFDASTAYAASRRVEVSTVPAILPLRSAMKSLMAVSPTCRVGNWCCGGVVGVDGCRVQRCMASAVAEDFESGPEPGWVDLHAGQLQSHLHSGKRAGEGEIVEIAEVTDPEDLALQLRQACTQRHVEPVEDE